MIEDPVWAVVYSVSPTILVGLIFWFVIRSIVRSDKNERAAYAKIEAEARAARGMPEAAEPTHLQERGA